MCLGSWSYHLKNIVAQTLLWYNFVRPERKNINLSLTDHKFIYKIRAQAVNLTQEKKFLKLCQESINVGTERQALSKYILAALSCLFSQIAVLQACSSNSFFLGW